MKNKIFFFILFFLLLSPTLVGAQSSPDNPQSGSVGLEGVVEGEPPTSAPTINIPSGGQTFSSIPITVSGNCDSNYLVSVYRNDIFAGSTNCNGGSFQIDIDLFSGNNTIYARHFDGLGQESGNSNEVEVTYNDPGLSVNINVSEQIVLQTLALYRGSNPAESLTWTFGISGGTGPYAVSINWGDGDSDVISREDTGFFDVKHTYDNPGTYPVVVKVSDTNDVNAFIQVMSVVNGPSSGDASSGDSQVKYLYLIWPLYILAGLVIAAFFLGNRYGQSVEEHKLEKAAIEKQKRMKHAAHEQAEHSRMAQIKEDNSEIEKVAQNNNDR